MPQKNDASAMAKVVERWLGNPMSRLFLRLIAKRCEKDGRRAENALKIYAQESAKGSAPDAAKLCTGCRFSALLVKAVLGALLLRLNLQKEALSQRLNDPVWRKGLSSVLEGIAEYGPEKPFTAYAPFLVVWNFTKACNLRCRHCYESAGKPDSGELSAKQALEAVDLMAGAGVAYVAISGGEPLMRKDLFEIAKRISRNEMGFSIATNGTLLSKESVLKLKEAGCASIQVSLDGAKAETHNWFRGADSFERSIRGIKIAVSEGVAVNVSTTVTRHNLAEIPQIIGLAEKLGAGFMHYNFIPTGKGKSIAALDLSAMQRENLLKMMAMQTKKRKMLILSTAPQYGRACVENEAAVLAMSHFDPSQSKDAASLRFLSEFIGGCGAGRLYCAFEPNGDIKPCVFMPIKIGNIRTDNLLGVWHNSEILKKIRQREKFKGNCGVCDCRNICGGCRARAYAYFSDIQGPDPGCIRNIRNLRVLRA